MQRHLLAQMRVEIDFKAFHSVKSTNAKTALHYLVKKCKFHNEQSHCPVIATAIFYENDECSADKSIKCDYVEFSGCGLIKFCSVPSVDLKSL